MIKQKLKAASLHFLVTLFVSILSAITIFLIWYPSPFTSLGGGTELWRLVVFVELTLGPVMSLVIYNQYKPVKYLILDYSVVGVLQIVALIYGLHTVYISRPVLLVLVEERIEVVNYSDLPPKYKDKALTWKESYFSPALIGTRDVASPEEFERLMFGFIEQGLDVHLVPEFYEELDKEKLRSVFGGVEDLQQRLGGKPLYQEHLKALNQYDKSFAWVPVKNGFSFWVAVISRDTWDIAEFFPIDSYDLYK